MNLKKIISGLLSIVLLSIVLPAQAQDAKAKSILDKASSQVKSSKTLKANFSLTMKDAKGASKQTLTGTFMMKGSKFRVNAGSQEIICDGKTVWTYLKKSNEVQISHYNPATQTVSPSTLFSGSYANEYAYSYKGSQSFAGKSTEKVELKPKSAKGFSRAELFVDNNGNIVGANVFEKNGSYYTYSISGVTPNSSIGDDQFVFNTKAHPGVEEVDLR